MDSPLKVAYDAIQIATRIDEERQYYKASLDEALSVIKQLDKGSNGRGFIWIHPNDLADMINNATLSKMADLFYTGINNGQSPYEIHFDGKIYRQSVFMPRRTEKLK